MWPISGEATGEGEGVLTWRHLEEVPMIDLTVVGIYLAMLMTPCVLAFHISRDLR
jgi:hypothetical protein